MAPEDHKERHHRGGLDDNRDRRQRQRRQSLPAAEALLGAGYTARTVLEVILGTAVKVMSNYTNHIAGTPLDKAFAAVAALAARRPVTQEKPRPLYLRSADARPQEGFALPRRPG